MTKKALISLVALTAAAVHILTGLRIDTITFGFVCLGVLPWITDVIKAVEVTGIGKVEFKDLALKVDQTAAKADVQAVALEDQRKKIETLARYSMSASVYTHLWGIANLPEYKYNDEPFFKREMYFLRDGGYIRPKPGHGSFLDFGPEMSGQNLAAIAEPTPAGAIVLELRGKP